MKRDCVTNIRVNRLEKAEVDEILSSLGLSFSAVVNMMMRQIILTKGVPFAVVVPSGVKTEVDMQGIEEEVRELTDGDGGVSGMEEEAVSDYTVLSEGALIESAGEEIVAEELVDEDFEALFRGVSDLRTDYTDLLDKISDLKAPYKENSRGDNTVEMESIIADFQSMDISG